MNLANKLTLVRVALIPLFILFVLLPGLFHHNFLWALVVFVLASITDAIDGKIARARTQVTDFGKFVDPLADKALVIAALICLVKVDTVGAIAAIIIILREFFITSFRLLACDKGVVIAADKLGKLKTIVQMSCISFLLLVLELKKLGILLESAKLSMISFMFVWLMVTITVVSGINYVLSNQNLVTSLADER